MESEKAAFAQRSRVKLHFDHKEMDFYFSWIVGRQIFDGSDEAECYQVASRIEDGDITSWQEEWVRLAEEVEGRAKKALDEGNREGARKAYLRACTYYRAPLFIMGPDDPRFRTYWRKQQACFRVAAELFEPPVERVQVPFAGKLLDGYFWAVDGSGARRPTLLLVGGMETFAEDCYFLVGQIAAQRGYNVLTVDLPGQGTNPEQGLYLEARMEFPVGALVDYAVSRPDVDPQRLVLCGYSWGGYIVFKGAEHEPRIKAMIANPPMPYLFRAALAQQGDHGRSDPVAKIVFDQVAWRFGLRISWNLGDLARRMVKAYEYFRYGNADLGQIQMPVLCIAGEGEAEITLKIARQAIERLPNPKNKLVIFTAQDGGEAHCQVNNLALPNRVMFDWLEEVFDGGA